jgi:hypothetical protein
VFYLTLAISELALGFMEKTVVFSRDPHVTEPEVWSWAVGIKQGDESAKEPLIQKFIRHRLTHRYITPLQGARSGFLIMAGSCLLIETLQSFVNGWDNTEEKSQRAFKEFFETNTNLFPDFTKYFPMVPHPKKPGKKVNAFYRHIRCAILHQAETTGGYSIVRDKKIALFSEKCINADEFLKQMDICVNNYITTLSKAPCKSPEWDQAAKKVKHICDNCFDPPGHASLTIR